MGAAVLYAYELHCDTGFRLRLESACIAETETKYSALELRQECVTAHSGVCDARRTSSSLIKTETDVVSIHSWDIIKTESQDFTEQACVTHLHPEKVKEETDDGFCIKAEHRGLLDNKCIDLKSDEVKIEFSEVLVNDLMNTVLDGAAVDEKSQIESIMWLAGEPQPKSKNSEVKKSELIQDEGISTRKKRLKCSQLEKSFSWEDYLKIDQRIHTSKKSINAQCVENCSYRNSVHYLEESHACEKRYKCDECGKSLTQNNALRHMKIHTGEKPYKCDQCEKSFSRNCHLKDHRGIHTGKKIQRERKKKPFKCDHCGKYYFGQSRFIEHQRIHTGEKPFKCDQCGMCYAAKSVFKGHQKIHTGERPYKCNQCEKCFLRRSHLKVHQRIHAGEKPYICDQCKKSFRRKDHLKSHQKIHAGKVNKNVISKR
ncbi:hypothetical protein GJAV_G00087000 [Gymnothorax javanicus]|nr:hypothetical protein GJAV_G00087000 [Gymnothorax javanicus]